MCWNMTFNLSPRILKLLHFLTLHCIHLCLIVCLLGATTEDCSVYLAHRVLQVQWNKDVRKPWDFLHLGFPFTHSPVKYSLSGLMSLKNKPHIPYSNVPHNLICLRFQNIGFSAPMIHAKIPPLTWIWKECICILSSASNFQSRFYILLMFQKVGKKKKRCFCLYWNCPPHFNS